jgi:hypothetical protein
VTEYPRLSRRWIRPVGLGLMVLSAALYGMILLLPLPPFPAQVRLAAVPGLVILGEIAFGGGGALPALAGSAPLEGMSHPRRGLPLRRER